jgi:hypothetical protein
VRDAKKNRVQRIGVWFYAVASALFVMIGVPHFSPKMGLLPTILILSCLFIGFYFAWRWVFFERQDELNKKFPVSSKELRRRKKEFYDSLPR